jgi:hypothetical protein
VGPITVTHGRVQRIAPDFAGYTKALSTLALLGDHYAAGVLVTARTSEHAGQLIVGMGAIPVFGSSEPVQTAFAVAPVGPE